jgi:integrase
MSIYKRGGSPFWWLDVAPPNGGPRVRESTGERERARAQRVHDEFKAELWKRRRSGRTFHGALEAWAKGKGHPDRARVGKLKRLTPDWPLDSLDADKLAALIPGKTPATFNRYLNLLGAAGIPVEIPRRKAKKGGARTRWLTADEWKALRAELPAWQVPMADFALSTGLRQANVFRLEWEQVDLKRKMLWVHGDQAKAGKVLRVKLQPIALRVLKGQQGKHPRWVFISEKTSDKPSKRPARAAKWKPREAKPPSEIKVGWKAALKRSKVAHCTWHDLRHTWASWHVMGGTPLEVLQKLGGWADIRMVQRYAHLADSHIDQFAGNSKPYQPSRVTLSRHTAA